MRSESRPEGANAAQTNHCFINHFTLTVILHWGAISVSLYATRGGQATDCDSGRISQTRSDCVGVHRGDTGPALVRKMAVQTRSGWDIKEPVRARSGGAHLERHQSIWLHFSRT